MAINCMGCLFDITAWTDSQHFVGSAASAAPREGFTFCASCWEAVEDWFLNTPIDQAIWEMCSGTSATVANATNKNVFTELCLYHNSISSSIDPREYNEW